MSVPTPSKLSLSTKGIIIFILFLIINLSLDLFIKLQVEKHLVKPYNQQTLSSQEYLLNYPSTDDARDKDLLVVREIVVIPNFWSFIYIRNYNVGFSILSFLEQFFSAKDLSHYLKYVQLIGVLLIFYLYYSFDFKYTFSFNLMISGGLGNIIDRFLHGYVIDYVKWYIPGSPIKLFDPWPIFNLADVFVSIGMVSLIAIMIFESIKSHRQTTSN